ncbi:MAG: galactose mutarotase, partial [Chryseobacterium sp.]
YYGATIGRFANRIKAGKFSIDGVGYQIPPNNGPNSNHGGADGLQNQIWDAHKTDDSTVEFSYLSKDGTMGFPGNLQMTVTYHLTSQNSLEITYKAYTDKKTIINLTNHAFFNLNGEGNGDILNHTLQIFSGNFTPIDSVSIPTGEISDVSHTPFDFLKPQEIGEKIDADNQQIKYGKGYDHNYVLTGADKLKHAAKVVGDKTGIVMDVYTDQPGLQFYSGNFMKEKNILKNSKKDIYRSAFCLETQHFPDSPNRENFPTTILNVGDVFTSISYYRFSTAKN